MIAYYIYDTSCLFFTYCLYTNEKNKLCRSYRFDGKLTQKFFMSTDEIESAVYALKDSRVHCNDIRRNEPAENPNQRNQGSVRRTQGQH